MPKTESSPTTYDLRSTKTTSKKVAIVCDWLVGIGGAERVVYEIHKLYPDAPIYTSQYDPKKIDWFKDADVRTTWLQKLPKSFKKFMPVLRAWTFSRLDLSDYDLVISCSGAEAKGVKTGKNTLHVCYCHAPTHYYWRRYEEYLVHPGFGKKLDWLARIGLKLLVGPLRRWDLKAAKRPDLLIANSTYIQGEIKKYYKRDSTVIFPPVETDRFKTPEVLRHGCVTAGRQTPYKRIDLAVAAGTELNTPLVVIGNGPDNAKLEKMAGRSVVFLTNVSDEEMPQHFASAKVFIFPTNVEDFGVTAVEAMAAGTPVVAYKKGGPLDYIIPNKTGVFFDKLTPESVTKAVEQALNQNFNYDFIRSHAQQFSVNAFRKNLQAFIKEHTA